MSINLKNLLLGFCRDLSLPSNSEQNSKCVASIHVSAKVFGASAPADQDEHLSAIVPVTREQSNSNPSEPLVWIITVDSFVSAKAAICTLASRHTV
jgi:hypothetical protein